MVLKKFCGHCGCNRLIDCTERYCEAHKHKKRDRTEIMIRTIATRKQRLFITLLHGRTSGSRYLFVING